MIPIILNLSLGMAEGFMLSQRGRKPLTSPFPGLQNVEEMLFCVQIP